MTLALGEWASRVIDQGHDKQLGRWSYLELVGQYGKRLIVVSAYRVCAQEFDATSNTVTTQQHRILQQLGNTSPNPRKQFIRDLIQQIQAWHEKGKEVLLGMDANEDVDHPQSDIMRLFNETDLIDLHTHCYPATPKLATHQRGSHPIDLIAGSPRCAAATRRTWMLPFGMPPLIKGDHRLLGIDLDTNLLFGNSPTNPIPTTPRGINSKHDLHVAKFCKEAILECNKHKLAERLEALKAKNQLSAADLLELEIIDAKITRILVSADHRCCPLSNTPWSPAIQTAYLRHRYWSLKLTAFRTQKDFSSAIRAIERRLDPTEIQQTPSKSLSAHLKQAQKQLRQARHDAERLRRAHTEEILNQALAAKQQKKSQALKYLIRAK